MPDLLGMIDQVATSEAPTRRPTRRGRRRRGPSRDEVLAETRSALDASLPEAGGAPSRDDVLAATRGALTESFPETQPEPAAEFDQSGGWPDDPEYRAEHRAYDPTNIKRRDAYRPSFRNEDEQDAWDDRADTNTMGPISPDDEAVLPTTTSPLKGYERQSYALTMPEMGGSAFRSPRLTLDAQARIAPHAEPDADELGGPSDMDEDDAVAPEADDVAAVPRAPGMRAPLPHQAIAAHGRVTGGGPVTDFAQRFDGASNDEANNDPMPPAAQPSDQAPTRNEAGWEPDPDEAAAAPAEMMTTEEALGPNSRYTAAELAEMERGKRLDRITHGIQGGSQMLGGLLGIIGGATGRQGLGAFGLGMGHGGHEIPAPNNYERAKAEANERLRLKAEDEARAASAGYRARMLDINERNAASGAENASANRSMRELAERRNQQEFDAEHNPQSPAAENARRRFAALLETYGASVGDWSDVVETLPQLGAAEIQANIQDLEDTVRGRRAARRRGRGGGLGLSGGGGGGSHRPPVPEGEQTTGQPLLDRAIRGYMSERQWSWDEALAYLTDDGATRNTLSQRLDVGLNLRDTQTDVTAHRDERSEQVAAIPGLVRSLGAPVLSAHEAENARDAWVTFRNLSANAIRLRRLAERLRASESAAGHGIAGVRLLGPDLATANALQEAISNQLREIGHYGVPSAAELERMERLAPRLDTLDGLLNAANAYESMRRAMYNQTREWLGARGYSVEGAR